MCDISNSSVQRFQSWYFPDKPYLPVKYRVNEILSYLTCIHITGDSVLTLTANDGDAGDTVEYSITGKVRLPSRKQIRITKTPYTPLSYSKTGVYRGIHF